MTVLWILLILFVILIGFLLAASRGFQNPRKPNTKTPADFGIAFQEESIPTKNSRRLYGWWIPAKEGSQGAAPTIVLIHGWGRNVERVLPYIEALYPEGYNLVAFDSRHHGRSDPDGYSSMIKFAEDIIATIDFAVAEKQANPNRIGVIGLSIGGAAALYAAALDSRIRAGVTVGAFAHPGDLMRTQFKQRGVPYFPLVWLLFQYVQVRIGKRFSEIAPENNLRRTKAHFLVIHGEEDRVVPLEHGRRLQKAGDPERLQFWIVPGMGHSDCHQHAEFWPKVKGFLKDRL